MKQKFYLLFFTILLTWTLALANSDPTSNTQTRQEKPIVIHTPVQGYDTPTFNEYQECQENLDKCHQVCETSRNRDSCLAECPVCPLLFQHEIVVQGINDTDLRSAVDPPVNTTNVIKLTNEIHNLIETKMGNVTARNENNVHIHNNVSHTGGEFGLGYNQRGSCCLVVRRSKNCNTPKFATGSRCHHKRLRVCGDKCRARVMFAKPVKHCPDDTGTGCYSRMTYVPYHRPQRRRCRYSPVWPFVACGRSAPCQRCLQLSYGYILRNGVPNNCMPCYRQSSPPRVYPATNYFYGEPESVMPERDDFDFGEDDFMRSDGNDWTVAKKKCSLPDGTIVNCDGSDNDVTSGDPLDEDDDVFFDQENNDIYGGDEGDEVMYDTDESFTGRRPRRQTPAVEESPAFRRSKYSHRYRTKIVE